MNVGAKMVEPWKELALVLCLVGAVTWADADEYKEAKEKWTESHMAQIHGHHLHAEARALSHPTFDCKQNDPLAFDCIDGSHGKEVLP